MVCAGQQHSENVWVMGKPTSKDLTKRLKRVWEKLADEHLDAFLVTHVPNIRYLTNFEGS